MICKLLDGQADDDGCWFGDGERIYRGGGEGARFKNWYVS